MLRGKEDAFDKDTSQQEPPDINYTRRGRMIDKNGVLLCTISRGRGDEAGCADLSTTAVSNWQHTLWLILEGSRLLSGLECAT